MSKICTNNSKTILLTLQIPKLDVSIVQTKIELKHRTKVLTDKSSLYIMNEEQRKYLGKRFSIKYIVKLDQTHKGWFYYTSIQRGLTDICTLHMQILTFNPS